MTFKKIMPCLDMQNGRVVKGVQFVDIRDAGDPVECCIAYCKQGADELALLDITATVEGRSTMLEVGRRVAEAATVPFTVGGGISDLKIAENVLMAGADKFSVSTAAFRNPKIIEEMVREFGPERVTVAVDVAANQTLPSGYEVFIDGGRTATGKDAIEWIKQIDGYGVGAILPTSKTTAELIPWVTGLVAGTAVNKSATNVAYDGEYDIDTDYTQTELENGIKEGSFMFHLVDDQVRVLTDINTFVSITDEKSGDFSSNQTIRVLDQIANDIAVLFGTKYIGKVPNDNSGRISLWNDIVKHHQALQDIRAIENFNPDDVTVEKGDTKKAVVVSDYVTPVNAMEQLYMTVYVQ